jgi:hypothetical protein
MRDDDRGDIPLVPDDDDSASESQGAPSDDLDGDPPTRGERP